MMTAIMAASTFLSSSVPGPDDMVTDSNPTPSLLSLPGLDHSPLSSYVSGTLGFGEACVGYVETILGEAER